MKFLTVDFIVRVAIALLVLISIGIGFKAMRKYILRIIESTGTLSVNAKRATSLKYALAVVRVIVIFIYIVFLFVLFDIPGSTIVSFFGLVSVAISLLMREILLDYVFGFLILLEGKVRIGDEIVVEGFKGTVEIIELRTSKLRDGITGDVFIVSNRHFTKFIRKKSRQGFIIDVTLPVDKYEESTRRINSYYRSSERVKRIDFVMAKTTAEKTDVQIIVDAINYTYDNLRQEILQIISEV